MEGWVTWRGGYMEGWVHGGVGNMEGWVTWRGG